MMKFRFASRSLLVLFLTCSAACLASDTLGAVTSVAPIDHGVELRAGRIAVRIEAVSPSVIRVRYAHDGQFSTNHSFAVIANAELKPPQVSIKQTTQTVEVSTPELRVVAHRNPLMLSFLTAQGTPISSDDPARPVEWSGPQFRIWKQMPADEHYYGLGDKAGPIDHYGQSFTMWTTDAVGWVGGSDPLYKAIPFFMALRNGNAYGVFLDNTFRSNFDFGKTTRRVYSFGAEGGELNYYFFYGPEPKKVIRDYTALTGRTPLPPMWALGYQQSRYSYYPEQRVRDIAREFRTRKIPADVIYLDIDYEEGHTPFTIDRQKFPNFEGMVRDLKQQGFKIITIVDLHTKKQEGYRPYDEGIRGDHFVKNADGSVFVGNVWPGPSVFPDFTQDVSRIWYGTLYDDFVRMGVRGIWNDMNEPSVFYDGFKRLEDRTMPDTVVHRVTEANGERKAWHAEIHNVFGTENARSTYDGVRKLAPNLRPFVLTRAGFAGAQRYAATWTGDNQSTWEHYRLMAPTLLSLGISGYPFVGADIGGFDGSPTPDLLTRFIQLGAFTPLYRDHTSTGTLDQEPWVHGPEHEAIRRRYIEARYRLMPYLYTNMEETTRTGVPLMRAMFVEFPNDRDFDNNDSEFMFGNDLLIAPKLTDKLDPIDVSFPAGSAWYDYWTGAPVAFDPKKPLRLNPKLDELPVYARAGAIIPHQPLVQSTAETPNGPLELRVFPGPNCHGSLYTDDGDTFDYTRGAFLRQSFTCTATNAGLTQLNLAASEGSYTPWWKTVQVVAYGAQHAPARVTANGQAVQGATFDANSHSVTFSIPWQRGVTAIKLDY
jgi:alpha-glucosidase